MKFNFLVSGYAITDEILNRSVSTALKIGHDLFIGTGLEIWTGAGGTGTQLALTTDYVLNGTDSVYTAKVGETVYTKLALVNGAYQNVDLYLTYTTVGDYSSVENVTSLALDVVNSMRQTLLDDKYPVGSFYTQYPDADSNDEATAFPTAMEPATLFGGTWEAKWNTEKVYFSTQGTDGQTRTNGLSADQMQQITGQLTQNFGDFGATASGALSKTLNASSSAFSNGAANRMFTLNFDSAQSTGARTGTFTEPKNRLMKIWKRTALLPTRSFE